MSIIFDKYDIKIYDRNTLLLGSSISLKNNIKKEHYDKKINVFGKFIMDAAKKLDNKNKNENEHTNNKKEVLILEDIKSEQI